MLNENINYNFNDTNKRVVDSELTDFTVMLINRLSKYKDKIKESKVLGNVLVLRGVEIFEEMIKEVNPISMSEDEVELFWQKINSSMLEREYRLQNMNSYIRLGIQDCVVILWGVVKSKKYVRVKEV